MAHEQSVIEVSSSTVPLLSARQHRNSNLDSTTLRASYTAVALPMNIFCNLVFIIVAIVMLCVYRDEQPNTPLRAWIIVYTVQTLVQILMDYCVLANKEYPFSVALGECISTIFYLIWWVFGLYWVVSGGNILRHDAPHLYWLTVVFLAFRIVATVTGCVLVPLVCCCCLRIIAAIVAD